MDEEIEKVREILVNIEPKDVVFVHHFDHDGITSKVLFDKFFKKDTVSVSKLENVIKYKKRIIIILDYVIRNFSLLFFIKDRIIINLDHHEPLRVNADNIIDLNPHRFGYEYINTSGLVWLVLKDLSKEIEDYFWLAGIGALQDYAIWDNRKLLKYLISNGYLSGEKMEDIVSSELTLAAKYIDASVFYENPKKIYEIIKRVKNLEDIFECNILRKNYKKYNTKFLEIYKRTAPISIGNIKFYIFEENPALLISSINELEKDKKIYIGYGKNHLSFRSLFFDYDVRKLAKLFGGGGPHPKAAGAYTKMKTNEIIKKLKEYFI